VNKLWQNCSMQQRTKKSIQSFGRQGEVKRTLNERLEHWCEDKMKYFKNLGCNNKVWTESSRPRMIRPLVFVYLLILYSWMKTVMYCFV
jgi:hypothetical protein